MCHYRTISCLGMSSNRYLANQFVMIMTQVIQTR